MKIKRDIKQPEWRQKSYWHRAELETHLALEVMGNEDDWYWVVQTFDFVLLDSGFTKTLERGKAAAFEAYLNLIFH